MKKIFAQLLWLALALLGAFAYATIALQRGESVNSAYLLIAAVCHQTRQLYNKVRGGVGCKRRSAE